MVKYLKPARYGFENDAKHLTAVQQKNYTVYREKVNFTFQNGHQSVLKLAKITEFSFHRCFWKLICHYCNSTLDIYDRYPVYHQYFQVPQLVHICIGTFFSCSTSTYFWTSHIVSSARTSEYNYVDISHQKKLGGLSILQVGSESASTSIFQLYWPVGLFCVKEPAQKNLSQPKTTRRRHFFNTKLN